MNHLALHKVMIRRKAVQVQAGDRESNVVSVAREEQKAVAEKDTVTEKETKTKTEKEKKAAKLI